MPQEIRIPYPLYRVASRKNSSMDVVLRDERVVVGEPQASVNEENGNDWHTVVFFCVL